MSDARDSAGLAPSTLAVLGAFAFLARGPGLDRSLWYDELFTLSRFAGSPADALTQQVAANNHPPASLLAWCMSAVASGEVGLRLPFALVGAASVVAIAWAVGRWGGRAAGLLAGALAALAPVHVLASQQVRGYPLMLLAGALLLGFLPALLSNRDDPPPRAAVAAVVLASALGVWSHATFLAALAGSAVCVAVGAANEQRRRALLALGVGAAGGVALLAPVISRTFKFVRANVAVGPPEGLHPGPLLLEDFGAVFGDGALLPLLLLTLAGIGTGRLLGTPQRRATLGLALFGPVVGLFGLLLVAPLGYTRFTLFAVPALLGLAGVGLASLAKGRRRVAVGALAALAVGSGLALRGQARTELQDFRGAMRIARERAEILQAPERIFGLGPGGELCAAYHPGTRADLDGAALRAALATGEPLVCVVPLPAWLDGSPLRAVLWSEAFASPVLVPGRESAILVVATRMR